jgi:PKD repeat protein
MLRQLLTATSLLLLGALSACSSARPGLGLSLGASLRVLDSAGNELPGAARLVSVPEGYAIYASDSNACGFVVEYGEGRHVVNVARGNFFGAEDLYLVASSLPGRVDIGGFQMASPNPVLGMEDEMLVARIVLGSGGGRGASAVLPTGDNALPRDFSVTVAADDSATFTWAYSNTGDYNQDGEVNISDLTVVGVNYSLNSSAANWPSARLGDGDENGEVNLGDIKPIGQHYQTTVNGYKLERASAGSGPYSAVATVGLADGTRDPALQLSHKESAAQDGGWYRVRAYSSADETQGAACAALQLHLQAHGTAPQPSFTYLPNPAMEGDTLQFSDTSTGDPAGWSWTFGDGGTSTAQNPSHAYPAAGQYAVALTANNEFAKSDQADHRERHRTRAGTRDNFRGRGQRHAQPGRDRLHHQQLRPARRHSDQIRPPDPGYAPGG